MWNRSPNERNAARAPERGSNATVIAEQGTKACDTFAPLGPCIARGIDPAASRLRTHVNGKVVQESSTGELVYDAPALVRFLSAHMTLLPGDVIYTGTPGTTSALVSGDIVEVEIDTIGVLRNRVA